MRKLIAAGLLLTLAGVACQTEDTSSGGPPPVVGSPDPAAATPTPAAAPPASKPAAAAERTKTMTVTLWYIVAGAGRFYLAPEKHTIPYTRSAARASLEELIHGKPQDPDHLVPYSKRSRIRSVSISRGVATVDWSAEVLRDHTGGSEIEALAIQQVVWTLTQYPSIDRVRFTVEGKEKGAASNGSTIEDWWGHVGLSAQPFRASAYMDDAAPIVLWTPGESARAGGALTLRGEVVAPSGSHRDSVRIVVRDASGREVVETHAFVTHTDPYGSQPWRTTFAKTITLPRPASAQTWTVSVAIHNMKDDGVDFAETRRLRVG